MSSSFDSWAEYHTWLQQNVELYAVYDVQESEGKITVQFISIEDWNRSHSK